MSVLDNIPGIVNAALGSVFRSAILYAPGAATSDGQGGEVAGTPVAHSCAGLVMDYSDAIKGLSNGGIQIHDRKAVLLAASLPAGIVPRMSWTIAIEGATWSVIAVKRDPAAATYDLQIRPA